MEILNLSNSLTVIGDVKWYLYNLALPREWCGSFPNLRN